MSHFNYDNFSTDEEGAFSTSEKSTFSTPKKSAFSTPKKSAMSKTVAKKEMQVLQDLGKALVDLNDRQLAQIPLPADLNEAIHQARQLKQREARRRQLQYIGRLMRSADYEAIGEAYRKLIDRNKQHTQRQHQVEHWRDRLLGEGNSALSEFMHQHPQTDSQHLRQLIRLALKEKQENKPPAQARKLFRYLLDVLEGGIDQGGIDHSSST